MTAVARYEPHAIEAKSRALPHDIDAEGAVLSAVLIDPTALGRVSDFLKPEHFYAGRHQWIWRAALDLSAAGTAVDVVTVASWLRERDRLLQVGGMGYLTEILNATPSPTNVRDHGAIVHEAWRKREAFAIFTRAAAIVETDASGLQSLLDALLTRVTTLAEDRPERPFLTWLERTKRYFEILTKSIESAGGPSKAIATGIAPFDAHVGGLVMGHKTTLLALSGVGKTQFAVQATVNAARRGIGVIFYSTELSEESLLSRINAHLSGVDSGRLEKTRIGIPSITPQDWKQLGEVYQGEHAANQKLPIHIDDRSDITADEIVADVKQWRERFWTAFGAPLGLVVVDYVQRLEAPSHMRREGDAKCITYGTKRLTKMAKALDVAVLEIAQQQTPEKGKEFARPGEYDCADSKTPVKEAQAVAYLYRPDREQRPDGLKRVNLYMTKYRNGVAGLEVPLLLDGATSEFSEVG